MKNMTQYVVFSAIAAAVVVFCIIGFLVLYSNNSQGQLSSAGDNSRIFMIPYNAASLGPTSLGLKKFNSTDELRNFLLDAQARNALENPAMQTMGGLRLAPIMAPVAPVPGVVTSAPASSQAAMGPAVTDTGTDYSTTNIQVSNVDEPDFLKNDAKYAYILSQDKLTIVDAYPGDTAKIVSKVGLDVKGQSLQNMFLNKDRLVIFYNGDAEQYSIPKYDYVPNPVYTPTTHAVVIDVSDRENPKILKNYEVNGNYFNARMIGNYVYFISTSNADYINPMPPVVRESSKVIISPPVYYYNNPEQTYNFNTVTSFDIFGDKINSQTYLMGTTGTLYVSNDAIYMAYQKNYYPYYYGTDTKDRFFKAILPLLPDDIQNKIKSIDQSNLDPDTKWAQISDLMQNTYNNMSDSDKAKLFDQIQRALQEYDTKAQEDSTKTVIEKITIDNGNLKYVAQGQVPGYLLNQYSMDQSGNRFRVATTSQYYNPENGNWQSNNVYVLDESLNIVGSLEKIAPNEKIFSARFVGDKLYLVTFHQVDPFFVISLSSDTPKVLGALKIPGYSSFLQPYDETHIIGIGKDTKQNEYGAVEPAGVKISLFDVSDVTNPVTVDTYSIGEQGTNSDVLSDPKALLFDKERDILSIPISNEGYGGPVPLPQGGGTAYVQPNNWKGFYVFGVDPAHGFSLKGKVEHYNATNFEYNSYYPGDSRSFYIENSLYTVTPGLLKINDLNDLTHEINQIKLDNSGQIIKYLPQ